MPVTPTTRERLRRALRERTPAPFLPIPGRRNDRPAAVLVPLRWDGDEPEALSILRSRGLRQHGGEVAFPGGKPEPGDDGLEGTALREAREELGIQGAQVLGALAPVALYTSDYRVHPFVAEIGPEPLVPDPGEVARVLTRPLRAFIEAPQIHALPFEFQGHMMLSPVFEWEGHAMYGGTAHAFYELLGVVAAALDTSVPPLVPGRYTWEILQRMRFAER